MKLKIGLLLVPMLSAGLLLAQQPLPIVRVLLAKNGMAYIVRSGQLNAPASITFHPDEMNDVLKSFSAWNPDSGALYSLGYTTGIPSSHMLSRFPFDMSGSDTGLDSFLAQVKGASVRLDVGRVLEGKLVAVQSADHVVQAQTTARDYRITVLLDDSSLQTVWLTEVRSIEFPDPELRDQLKRYLDVLAEGRQDVTREVSIYPSPGPGPVRVAYLQQFPLWKTSYRIDLGKTDSRIQGWAQIDNPTGEAWDNVEVSLLSGAPTSFVMNLYEPLYTSRSTLAVPGVQVAAPRQYESAVATDNRSAAAYAAPAPPAPPALPGQRGAQGQQGQGGGAGGGRGAAAGGVAGGVVGSLLGAPQAQETLRQADAFGTFQQAQATQLEDYFEYKFPFPVRLASRQSALLPFLQKPANIERLSIFNTRSDRGNPQLGARLENNTGVPLEPGPITFFEDGRYAGEAVVEYLPRAEKRLISYGIDHDIQIAWKQQPQPESTVRLTIDRGIAVLYMERLLATTYEVRNKAETGKTLIIEQPRVADRKLKTGTPWETTDSFYRFRLPLNAGQMTEFPVSEIVSRQTQVSLQNLTRAQLTMFSGSETPQDIRAKLGQIVDLQERIAALGSDLKANEDGISTVFRDQERLRENVKALRETREDQELRSRYLDQLTKQEDQIQAARALSETLNRDIAAARTQLGDLVANLRWQ